MKQNKKPRRANTLFTLAALFVVLMSNVQTGRAQTNELPDTVWTKFTYPNAINAVKFTPDGRYLASGGDDGVPRLWDAETGELIREFQGNDSKIWSLDINNTGEMLAIVNNSSEIFVWNLENGDSIQFIDVDPTYKTMGGSLSFSNQGKYLAANLVKNGKEYPERDIYLFNSTTFEIISVFKNLRVATKMCFSPMDNYLAVANSVYEDKTSIMIFKVPSLIPIANAGFGNDGIMDCDFSQDNLNLAGALSAEPNKIWTTSDWSLKNEIGNGGDSKAIEFSPDGKYVVFQKGYFGNRHIQIWENQLMKYEYPVSSLASSISISPDMKFIASSNGSGIIVYNAKWNPTSVEEESIQILEPEIFPNPNDGKAIIRFNLLKNAEVSVDIFDINSRLILNIFKGQLNSGIQPFEWLAKVPNGIYFAKISSGKTVSSIKIIVQR